MKKLRLKKYPYTYARVSVMRSFLLSKEEYHKLLKMDLNEVISFLQGSSYKPEIDANAVNYAGTELMEISLNANLAGTWRKLRKISSSEVGELIDAYLTRADIWNIKTIIRGIHSNTKVELSMLLPAGSLQTRLESLVKIDSIEEILKQIGSGFKQGYFTASLDEYKSTGRIAEIETALDKHHFAKLWDFAQKIPSEGKLFQQFLNVEADTTNIINILRLKKAGMDKKKITNYLSGKPSSLHRKLIETDRDGDIALLSKYNVDLSQYAETGSLIDLEIGLGSYLLGKTRLFLHQNPLSVSVILGYMFAKEIEVKNLKLLIKARQLGMGNQFIEQQIII